MHSPLLQHPFSLGMLQHLVWWPATCFSQIRDLVVDPSFCGDLTRRQLQLCWRLASFVVGKHMRHGCKWRSVARPEQHCMFHSDTRRAWGSDCCVTRNTLFALAFC